MHARCPTDPLLLHLITLIKKIMKFPIMQPLQPLLPPPTLVEMLPLARCAQTHLLLQKIA